MCVPMLFEEPKLGGTLVFCPSSGGVFELEPEEFKALKENLPEL